MEATDQPATPGGVRIADGTRDGGGLTFDLIDVLDAIEPLVSGLTWEARCISSVWFDVDPWADSWADAPLRLDRDALRARWAGQIIDGRFAALDDDSDVLVIEAVDSSFWLVWSADAAVLSAVTSRFDDVTPIVHPTGSGDD
jgi:hypothetical protein